MDFNEWWTARFEARLMERAGPKAVELMRKLRAEREHKEAEKKARGPRQKRGKRSERRPDVNMCECGATAFSVHPKVKGGPAVVIVDAADAKVLRSRAWMPTWRNRGGQVSGWGSSPPLHRLLLKARRRVIVRALNGCRLDCRRRNLAAAKIRTPSRGRKSERCAGNCR